DLERRVRADHPMRAIRETANGALDGISADFSALYAPMGCAAAGTLFDPLERRLMERAGTTCCFSLVRVNRHQILIPYRRPKGWTATLPASEYQGRERGPCACGSRPR